MASKKTFLSVVAADALHATICGINAVCNYSLIREIIVPRFACAICNCFKGLYKTRWQHGIVFLKRESATTELLASPSE